MSTLSLVVFDMDGTLIDSQKVIVSAMQEGFAERGHPVPTPAAVLSIVGLSLVEAVAGIAPHLPHGEQVATAEAYKQAFIRMRESGDGEGHSPMYPGAREVLLRLAARENTLLGVATGKALRGVHHAVEAHALEGVFQTVQTADGHPSKPHPSMLEHCLSETGVDVARAVMIGDTTYDIEMGVAAGFQVIGVPWGYHEVRDLRAAGADVILRDYETLEDVLAEMGL